MNVKIYENAEKHFSGLHLCKKARWSLAKKYIRLDKISAEQIFGMQIRGSNISYPNLKYDLEIERTFWDKWRGKFRKFKRWSFDTFQSLMVADLEKCHRFRDNNLDSGIKYSLYPFYIAKNLHWENLAKSNVFFCETFPIFSHKCNFNDFFFNFDVQYTQWKVLCFFLLRLSKRISSMFLFVCLGAGVSFDFPLQFFWVW